MTVGVHPPDELATRSRLFSALGVAFGVEFEPAPAPEGSFDGLIHFEGEGERAAADATVARLVIAPARDPAEPREVRFGASPLLDARLRGRRLIDKKLGGFRLEPGPSDEPLAFVGNEPAWLRRQAGGGTTDLVAFGPPELRDGEYLKDRLDPGRFFELLPLVDFLRRVDGSGWRATETRAAFVIDDPNLHWRSYGHIRFPDLVVHARVHRYHVSLAMVPLDAWYAHGRTVRLFRKNSDVVSLAVHGNDHRLHELGRPTRAEEARPILAQARRRIAAFERRTGLPVSPVLVPPHEACSAGSIEAALSVGFEAATLTRPCTWLPLGPPYSPYVTDDPDDVLSGWHPTEVTPSGLPIMIRRQYHEHDEIVLRAYLDQPVILYGHADDFADGLDPLAAAAEVVNGLPAVRWRPLEDVARGAFALRLDGEVLDVQAFARRVCVAVQPETKRIRLVRPPRNGESFRRAEAWIAGRRTAASPEDPTTIELPERERAETVELRWINEDEIDPATVPAARQAAAPAARRILGEARDRLVPLMRR